MLLQIDEVKSFLGIKSVTDDDKILTACQVAQKLADKAVDFTLEGSTFTEIQDCDGIDIIQLRNLPVKSITSLYNDFDRVYGEDTLISSDDYAVDEENGFITAIECTFQAGANAIKCIYVAGYNGLGQTDYTDLPDDLRQALIYLASALYIEGTQGVNAMAGQFDSRPKEYRARADEILATYRRMAL